MTQVNSEMEASQSQKPAPTCGLCGRKLGVGFYYTCHICGRTYCYAHIPSKCTHRAMVDPSPMLPQRIAR